MWRTATSIRTLAQLPIAPGVEAHSIMAVDGDAPLADASDGVVRYLSAHLDGVSSEAIVHSDHSAQGNPAPGGRDRAVTSARASWR